MRAERKGLPSEGAKRADTLRLIRRRGLGEAISVRASRSRYGLLRHPHTFRAAAASFRVNRTASERSLVFIARPRSRPASRRVLSPKRLPQPCQQHPRQAAKVADRAEGLFRRGRPGLGEEVRIELVPLPRRQLTRAGRGVTLERRDGWAAVMHVGPGHVNAAKGAPTTAAVSWATSRRRSKAPPDQSPKSRATNTWPPIKGSRHQCKVASRCG